MGVDGSRAIDRQGRRVCGNVLRHQVLFKLALTFGFQSLLSGAFFLGTLFVEFALPFQFVDVALHATHREFAFQGADFDVGDQRIDFSQAARIDYRYGW